MWLKKSHPLDSLVIFFFCFLLLLTDKNMRRKSLHGGVNMNNVSYINTNPKKKSFFSKLFQQFNFLFHLIKQQNRTLAVGDRGVIGLHARLPVLVAPEIVIVCVIIHLPDMERNFAR